MKKYPTPAFAVCLLFSLALVTSSSVAKPVEAAEVPGTPVVPSPEITQPPGSTLVVEQIYPYYLPLATKPDIAPQTIDGVTTVIDWAYVDESRVALHYTISGLDWPDGVSIDSTLVQITSEDISDIGYGGEWGGGMTVKSGVITAGINKMFIDDTLNGNEHPSIGLRVGIPVDGTNAMLYPTSAPGELMGPPVNVSLPVIGTFHFEFNVPVHKGVKFENMNQTFSANNVSMTLKTLVLNPSRAEALICFQMPSAQDWGLTASTVSVGGKEYPFSGGGLLPGTNGKGFSLTDPERCSTVGFDIPYDESAASISLTVPKLLASVPEIIDKERVEIANRRLAGSDIEFDYENVDHGGNVVILKRLEGATDEEIYPLIWDALADQYEGPWVFTVRLKQ